MKAKEFVAVRRRENKHFAKCWDQMSEIQKLQMLLALVDYGTTKSNETIEGMRRRLA